MPKGKYTDADVAPRYTEADVQDSATPNYALLTANTKKDEKGEYEGLYKMRSPQGAMLQIPFSNVDVARQAGFQIDPEHRTTYGNDLFAALKKKNPNISRDHMVLPDAYATVTRAPEVWSSDWWKQKGLDAVRYGTGQLPNIGGIAGGSLGLVAGAPTTVGAIATAGAGAAAGGLAGAAARNQLNEAIFHDEPPRDWKAELKDDAAEGALQGLYEVTGRIAALPLKAAGKYFTKTALKSQRSIAPGVPAIRQLPSEAYGKPPSWLEKFLKGSIFTSGTMSKFRAAQNEETQKAVDALANQIATFTGSKEDLGKLVQQGIEQHKEVFRAAQKALYDDIDRKAAPANIRAQTANLKVFAREKLAHLDEEEEIIDPTMLSSHRKMLETIIKSPADVKFSTMARVRSALLDIVRDEDVPLAGKRAGFAKKLAGLADESMMDAANNSGIPGLGQDVRHANEITRTEHERFEQKLVKGIVKHSSPEHIAGMLGKRGVGLQETRSLFEVLPVEYHARVQRQLILDTAEGAVDNTSGVFSERKFAKSIDDLGDARGQVIFGQNWVNVKRLSRVLGQIGGSSGLGSSAALQNVTMMKNMMVSAAGLGNLVAVGYPLAEGAQGDWSKAGKTAAKEFVFLRALAYVMTNPGAAVKMARAGELFAQGMRAAAPAMGAALQSASDNRKRNKQGAPGDASAGGNMGDAPLSKSDVYTGIGGDSNLRSQGELRKPTAQPISVTAPDGQVIVFQNQAAADQFKAAAGIQ